MINILDQSMFRGNSCFIARTIPDLINIPFIVPSIILKSYIKLSV